MILEHALLTVDPGRRADFEAAFAQAKALIAAMPGFRWLSLSRCLERTDGYLLLTRSRSSSTTRRCSRPSRRADPRAQTTTTVGVGRPLNSHAVTLV